jgi:hypothetical protein
MLKTLDFEHNLNAGFSDMEVDSLTNVLNFERGHLNHRLVESTKPILFLRFLIKKCSLSNEW